MSPQLERKRKHTPEFKVQAVRLMRERLASGVTLQRVGEELDVGADQLRVWARQVEEAPEDATAEQIFPGQGHKRTIEKRRVSSGPVRPLSLEDELQRLKRENERLRQERDFLKKAAAFFAKESR
jgi:transposase